MWSLRRADLNDLDCLVEMRLRFLEEIGNAGDRVEGTVRNYLHEAMPREDFIAWVAVVNGQIVATSGLVFSQKVPHARNLSGREGFVLNMYTLPDHRGRGIATALMEKIVEEVRSRGITCIRLHASADGSGIYTKLGFQPDRSGMVLHLRR